MKKYIRILAVLLALLTFIAPVSSAYAEGISGSVAAKDDGVSQVDLVIAYARSQIGSGAFNGYCQRFVKYCFRAAGITGDNSASAYGACEKWLVSTSRDNIPVGAVMYFNSSSYGHSAIYLGNNRFIHAVETVVEDEISTYFWDRYIGWGWECGIEPTGTYISNDDVLANDVYLLEDNVGMYTSPAVTADGYITLIASGAKISVSDTFVDENGDKWGRAKYYSTSGYIKMDFCSFLYTAAPSSMTLNSVGGAVRQVSEITVSRMPDRFYYRSGDGISLDGLEIEVTYAGGDKGIVTDEDVRLYTPVAHDSGYNFALIGFAGNILSVPMVVSDCGDTLKLFRPRENDISTLDFGRGALIFKSEADVNDIRKVFGSVYTLWIYSASGELKESGSLVTGDYICYATDKESATVTVVIDGDVSGDGRSSALDTLMARRYQKGQYDIVNLPNIIASESLRVIGSGGSSAEDDISQIVWNRR